MGASEGQRIMDGIPRGGHIHGSWTYETEIEDWASELGKRPGLRRDRLGHTHQTQERKTKTRNSTTTNPKVKQEATDGQYPTQGPTVATGHFLAGSRYDVETTHSESHIGSPVTKV